MSDSERAYASVMLASLLGSAREWVMWDGLHASGLVWVTMPTEAAYLKRRAVGRLIFV